MEWREWREEWSGGMASQGGQQSQSQSACAYLEYAGNSTSVPVTSVVCSALSVSPEFQYAAYGKTQG